MYYKRIQILGGLRLEEIVTSRFSDELLKKMDQAVLRGHFRSRSEALRVMVEEYFREHPELLIGDGLKEMLAGAPRLSDEELENLGARLFEGVNVARLVSEGRERL